MMEARLWSFRDAPAALVLVAKWFKSYGQVEESGLMLSWCLEMPVKAPRYGFDSILLGELMKGHV